MILRYKLLPSVTAYQDRAPLLKTDATGVKCFRRMYRRVPPTFPALWMKSRRAADRMKTAFDAIEDAHLFRQDPEKNAGRWGTSSLWL